MLCNCCFADIDESVYETGSQRLSQEAFAEYQAELAAEIAADKARLEAEAQQAARAAQVERVWRNSRPYPERLVETVCTECHVPEQYLERVHSRPAWWLVVLRMRYLNGAEITGAEQQTIVAYLSERRPASLLHAVIEITQIGLAVLALPVVMVIVRQLRRAKER